MAMSTRKKVAVIGAGTSGLMAMKSLKEGGFEPVCFEKTDRYGGLWHYSEEEAEGTPSAMWSTSLNNSKEPGAISDFPPRPEFPNYMRHFKVLQMFREYGETFDLMRHIVYRREVVEVHRAVDYGMTGRWKVVARDTETGERRCDVFDGVVVCVGHLSLPHRPPLPGLDDFQGGVVHTHGVKKFLRFADRTVVVVGTGSSALDAAVEISHVAKQVYLSVRTPPWIATRQGPYGYPMDWTLFNRDVSMLQRVVPLSWCNRFVQAVYINPRFSHDLYNIRPGHGIACRDPAVNDGLPSRLMNGAVVLKKDVDRFTRHGVVFCGEDGEETPVDAVVLATGYKWAFPFLDDRDLVVEGGKVHLYKCVYPPQLRHPTLAVVGFVVPMGPGFPVVEMQCRWYVQVLAGKARLPRKEAMTRDIDRQWEANSRRFAPSDRLFIHIDFVPYLDDLAAMIGVKPNLWTMALTDFRLFWNVFFGVFVPYQYRLKGPYRWGGARRAILEAGMRMRAPLQGKAIAQCDLKKPPPKPTKRNVLVTMALVALYVWRKGLFSYDLLMFFIRVFTYLRSLATPMYKNIVILQKKLLGSVF